MEFLVESGSTKKRKFVEAILPSIIDQLGLTSSRKAVVIRIANECEGMGMTVPVDILDSYVVVISPRLKLKELGLTLAHEMVHVRQMAKGFLKTKKGYNYWCGKSTASELSIWTCRGNKMRLPGKKLFLGKQ